MMSLKQFFSIKFSVSLTITLLFLTATAILVSAQEGARVYLQTVDTAEDALVVDVVAENVTDLYGAEFRVRYDPAVVSVQDTEPQQAGVQIETGSLLPANQGFVVANETDEAEGIITFAMTLLNPAPPVNGAGPLARISFNKLQSIPSTIDVEHAKLVAINLETIPSQTETLAISGEDNQVERVSAEAGDENRVADDAPAAPAAVEEAPPAAERGAFPWWIVAAVIMVLGLLVVGGFIVMNGLKPATAPSGTSGEGATTNSQSSRRSGSRPSAFK